MPLCLAVIDQFCGICNIMLVLGITLQLYTLQLEMDFVTSTPRRKCEETSFM